ncbi:hypothetical protein [Flavobacterium pectinovorum]|nr:hypothetical protein [Flavobacterium pectinovorum]
MMLVSKFEKRYLLRNIFIPITCIVVSILLVTVKIYYKKNADVILPAIFLFIVGCLFLFYGLKSTYKVVVEKKTITKIYLLSRKKESFSYRAIRHVDKEFIDGFYSCEVGQITGYYIYIYYLENDKELIISSLYFKNYNELLEKIDLYCGCRFF